MKFSGIIYCHECKINGLRYFGSVFTGQIMEKEQMIDKLLRRWNAGFGYTHYCTKFGEAVKEYGFANFNHFAAPVYFTADEEYEAEEKLRNLEKAFITLYDSVKFGYNSRCGTVYYDVYDIWDIKEPYYNWEKFNDLYKPKYVYNYNWQNPTNWNMYGNYGKAVG